MLANLSPITMTNHSRTGKVGMYQLGLPITRDMDGLAYRDKLVYLLSQSLDFHGQDSGYASHDLHAFPAKFPPQLPRALIQGITAPGDLVLDPMAGSGTTILEAYLMGRLALGFDIDPLALLLTKAKVTALDTRALAQIGHGILERAALAARGPSDQVQAVLASLDPKTKEFVDYWFAPQTQTELAALASEIDQMEDAQAKAFFRLVLSAIIITKSGGVSLAFDLAHTRPHRAKVVYDADGEVLLGGDLVDSPSRRVRFLTKTLRSPLEEFRNRLRQNLQSLRALPDLGDSAQVLATDAQKMPLRDSSVDLIVTSPPYAANAIDYMRAHKFSLVWMGYPIDELGEHRQEYIGGDAISGVQFEGLPPKTAQIVASVAHKDERKGLVLHRYYSEMRRVLQEMFRVLKPGRAAIVVVGSSTMRGVDTQTHVGLSDLGEALGFHVPAIGVRQLDRNRRMMPAGARREVSSQIEQRMHQEHIIGFLKPAHHYQPLRR